MGDHRQAFLTEEEVRQLIAWLDGWAFKKLLTFNVWRLMRGTEKERYDLEDRLLDYAAAIIRLVEQLPSSRAGDHAAGIEG